MPAGIRFTDDPKQKAKRAPAWASWRYPDALVQEILACAADAGVTKEEVKAAVDAAALKATKGVAPTAALAALDARRDKIIKQQPSGSL